MNAGKAGGSKNSLVRSIFKPPRSPNIGKPQRSPFNFKPLRQSPYNRPVRVLKNKLYTIREESPEQIVEVEDRKDAYQKDASFYKDFDIAELSDGDEGESSETSDFEGWDDESTLVAKFQENAPELSEREKLANLAYQLEGPMQARGALLKQYLAHTIAPAARKVKEVHTVLEQKVDVTFGVGVLSFDDSCKKIEQLSLRDEEDLKNLYIDTQRVVRELFRQLRDAYQKRDQLWNNLHDVVDRSAAKTSAIITALPVDLDETISAIEKKSKDMSKSGGIDGKAKQKLLRELLAEM
ncbi:hypothetical protein DFH11DRAFT_1724241 [Phellopilus nigrolimitatus]|nr:hypothetical protein DFH11DRAFT_1724241 [Phellopilus nigrolimitatus]